MPEEHERVNEGDRTEELWKLLGSCKDNQQEAADVLTLCATFLVEFSNMAELGSDENTKGVFRGIGYVCAWLRDRARSDHDLLHETIRREILTEHPSLQAVS